MNMMSILWLVLQIVLGAAALGGARIALRGIRATDQGLAGIAKLIGTRDLRQARTVCWVTVIPFTLVGLGLLGGGVAFLAWGRLCW
jgi:hypothetical protein